MESYFMRVREARRQICHSLLVRSSMQQSKSRIRACSAIAARISSSEDAAEIIRSAVKKAGTGRKGQLAQTPSAFLVIGGFHLSPHDLDSLEQAACAYLEQLHKLVDTRISLQSPSCHSAHL